MNGPGSKKGNGYPSDNPPLTVTIGSLPTFSREPAPHPPFNKTFNRMQVRDTGGWWRIVINYGAKSAKFCLGEGEPGRFRPPPPNSDRIVRQEWRDSGRIVGNRGFIAFRPGMRSFPLKVGIGFRHHGVTA